jgi:aspartate 1-decarboxylase
MHISHRHGVPNACRLTRRRSGFSLRGMFREVLKSKLHRAMITDADVEYEGSIEIPSDLMGGADLWPGEKVLVASITTGARLETYVLEGKPDTGKILINGGAAHRIKAGERVTIMAFAVSAVPVEPKVLLLDDKNNVIREGR